MLSAVLFWHDIARRDMSTTTSLDIILETPNFVILNKLPDIKINSNNADEFTVETQLRRRFPDKVDNNLAHGFRYIHRLDYATSGLLCVAFNKETCSSLSKAFERRTVVKHYLALVHGLLENIIEVTEPIGRDRRVSNFCKMCVANSPHCDKPRSALTTIIPLQTGTYNNSLATKVLLIPHTGRTHQLRVHCSYLSHTIIGDYTYSNRADVLPERMMLHAYRLKIPLNQKNKSESNQSVTDESLVESSATSEDKCISVKDTYDYLEACGPDLSNVLDVRTCDPFLTGNDGLWQVSNSIQSYNEASSIDRI